MCSASAMKILCYNRLMKSPDRICRGKPTWDRYLLTYLSTSFTQKCVLLVSFAFRKQRASEEKVMFSVFGLVPDCLALCLKRWACTLFLLVRKSQIYKFLRCASPKIEIRKFVTINLKIANSQISFVSQSTNCKSENVQGKKQCF